jgi:hypothetical protein
MRLVLAACIVCVSVAGAIGVSSADTPPPDAAKSSPVATPGAPPPASSEAAEKHLKRTACLKQAKDRKLLGADKAAFLKDCIAAP